MKILMNRHARIGLISLLGALAFVTTSSLSVHAQADDYSITWWTIDSGGGSSSGGGYTLNGTVGQPDAGPQLSGGRYTLQGGFWTGIAAQPDPTTPISGSLNPTAMLTAAAVGQADDNDGISDEVEGMKDENENHIPDFMQLPQRSMSQTLFLPLVQK